MPILVPDNFAGMVLVDRQTGDVPAVLAVDMMMPPPARVHPHPLHPRRPGLQLRARLLERIELLTEAIRLVEDNHAIEIFALAEGDQLAPVVTARRQMRDTLVAVRMSAYRIFSAFDRCSVGWVELNLVYAAAFAAYENEFDRHERRYAILHVVGSDGAKVFRGAEGGRSLPDLVPDFIDDVLGSLDNAHMGVRDAATG